MKHHIEKESRHNDPNWIVEMTKWDHQTDITFTCAEREGAESMIHEIAMETERTYEEDGEGETRWFTIVNHKVDNWTVTVYFEVNENGTIEEFNAIAAKEFEKSRAEQERKHFMEQFKNMPVGIIYNEPDEFEHLKTDGEIPIFHLEEAMKYIRGNVGPSFKTEIPDNEPCRGSLDVGAPPKGYLEKAAEDSLDAFKYAAKKLMSEDEIAKQQSFETFRSREDHKVYSRYCKMMLDAGQTPALFDEFKNWARPI